MRLQLKDSKKTVITSFETEIRRAADFDSETRQHYYYIEINGMVLKYFGDNKQQQSQSDFNKLRNKGAVKMYEPPYIGEQERAHWEAVQSDCENEELHGHTVSVCIAGEHSSHRVWDYYKQTVVEKVEETKVLKCTLPNVDKKYILIGYSEITGLFEFKDTVNRSSSYWFENQVREYFSLTESQVEELKNFIV